jgi:hypothetical protein
LKFVRVRIQLTRLGAGVAFAVLGMISVNAGLAGQERIVVTGPLLGIGLSGRVDPKFPRIPADRDRFNLRSNNLVTAIADDGRGGWFIGGDFLSIGGVRCPALAHIAADSTIDKRWCKDLPLRIERRWGDRPVVFALVRRGPLLLVGGFFTSIGGKNRSSLAAVDLSARSATPWAPRLGEPDRRPSVYSISGQGRTIYLAGTFESVDRIARFRLAAVDASSGRPTGWNPDPDTNLHGDSADAVAATGSVVYVTGFFTRVGGRKRLGFAALDPVTGKATPFHLPCCARTPVVRGGILYLSGYLSLGGRTQVVSAFDIRRGKLLSWSPRVPTSDVAGVLGVAGDAVYIGHGTENRYVVEAYSVDGRAKRVWSSPTLTNNPHAIGVSPSERILGGDFYGIVR